MALTAMPCLAQSQPGQQPSLTPPAARGIPTVPYVETQDYDAPDPELPVPEAPSLEATLRPAPPVPDEQLAPPAQSAEQENRQPVAQPSSPMFLENVQKQSQQKAKGRTPATPDTQQSQTTAQPSPVGTQLAFIEVTPSMGGISIKGKTAYSVGSDISFHLSPSSSFYFEPSFFLSFLSGDPNTPNAMLFHLDGGLRYDFVINNSALVPFLKLAAGPTLSSSSTTVVNGSKLSDSYFNLFAGGGAKILISPSIAARADVGVTLQGTDTGLYAMGAIALPL
ncbi:MAG: hypothetical protein HY074_13720 [Deltaproteobacteria bacterium]|nr:hypothetical protein [Deltaproteobacteria bacterium]